MPFVRSLKLILTLFEIITISWVCQVLTVKTVILSEHFIEI
jgi:hypothetical protein